MELKRGDGSKTGKADLVKQLQSILNALYSFGLKVDGEYGALTGSAVAQVQMTYGLPMTGNLDSKTFNTLQGIYTGTIQKKPLQQISVPTSAITTGPQIAIASNGTIFGMSYPMAISLSITAVALIWLIYRRQ